ncbi:magnesium transporter [Paraphysoderma sedebokerense]|nr:magnesium transporter [Paraphysoderma sedebokerense]
MKEPKWWFGFILMICGEFGNFLAYGFAPASVVAPLGTIALAANAIIAPCALGETFRKRDLFGIILAIFGTVTIVLSAKQKETQFDPDALVEALLQPQFLIYFLFTVAAIIAMMSLSDTIGKRIILVDISLVALFGGYTVLATKGISSLLGLTFVKMFTYGITYLMVFVMISTGVMQIRYLNRALSRFDSTAVIPTQFVLFTICAIVGSALLYNDFDDVSPTLMITFIAGCCLTFLGVFLITSNPFRLPHLGHLENLDRLIRVDLGAKVLTTTVYCTIIHTRAKISV